MPNTLHATLRLKRRPISDEVICFKLRVSHMLPVHKDPLHEEDITDYASMDDINRVLESLRQRFKCQDISLDAGRDVLKRLERSI